MHRISDSVAICSDMIVDKFWVVCFVPIPLMFWNMRRIVLFGFVVGNVLPIHEVGGTESVMFWCLGSLSRLFLTVFLWLFGVSKLGAG